MKPASTTANTIAAIIVAGGKGLRMGGPVKKQYLMLDHIPVLSRTLLAFDRCEKIDQIILVVPGTDIDYCRSFIIEPYAFKHKISIVSGGKERQDSVWNGIQRVRKEFSGTERGLVLIHDGVRPFVSQSLITESIRMALEHKACVPCLKIAETVKQSDDHETIARTMDREHLYAAQTPQSFDLQLLVDAFVHAANTGFNATDDASVVEHFGKPVYIIDGEKNNIKLTTSQDLKLAQFLAAKSDG